MTITIPAFWCGVIVTVVVECVSLVGAAIVMAASDRKKKGCK